MINRWWVFLWLDWKSCQQYNAFSFCGLFIKTPGSRNVHKSRRSSPIWYLFSLSPRRDYLVTHLVIIFPSHPSELLHPSWFSCNLSSESPACFCLFVDNCIAKYHIIKSQFWLEFHYFVGGWPNFLTVSSLTIGEGETCPGFFFGAERKRAGVWLTSIVPPAPNHQQRKLGIKLLSRLLWSHLVNVNPSF